MSKTASPQENGEQDELTQKELLAELKKDPDEVLREHTDRLRQLREKESNELVIQLIDAVLEDYEEEGASA